MRVIEKLLKIVEKPSFGTNAKFLPENFAASGMLSAKCFPREIFVVSFRTPDKRKWIPSFVEFK